MSRVSQKSGLSPSITKGSNAIDLGKNSGVDLGQKSEPSLTSGGIGVTQEITNVGGMSVSVGGNIDITLIDFGINVNPSEGTVAVATCAEIPGGLLGISGGIEIDTNTGEIIGGSIGGEVGGLGINASNSKKGGVGIEFTVQIPGTPIEFSLGLGFPPKKEEPTPTPTPIPKVPITFENPLPYVPPLTIDPNCKYWIKTMRTYKNHWDGNYRIRPSGTAGQETPDSYALTAISLADVTIYSHPSRVEYQFYNHNGYTQVDKTSPYINNITFSSNYYSTPRLLEPINLISVNFGRETIGRDSNGFPIYSGWQLTGTDNYVLKEVCENKPLPPSSPFPNPPPRRQKMDECCRTSIKLQRLIVRHIGAERNSSNQEILPEGVRGIGSTQEGIRQAYPFDVKKCWVDPNAKETESISILNDRQLALVLGGMIERLERTLGTAEFYKDSDKKLRQSEGNMLSWLTGKNNDFKYPDPNDFWLNTDDGVINEKTLEIRSIADGLRYQVEALNRLERILPIAELKDSSIPRDGYTPMGKGNCGSVI